MNKVKVGINGYGVIGKRMADAVSLQDDMELIGICDLSVDYRIQMALSKKYSIYVPDQENIQAMDLAEIPVQGTLNDLIDRSDIIVDCTPKNIGAENSAFYKKKGIKFILQGGEKHEHTGHSFFSEANYKEAVNRDSTRVVSCNTTAILRTLNALKIAGLLKSARGTLLRRATDPWESHLGGIMNSVVPEAKIPSHQGPDAKKVIPDIDVVTMAVKVPETLSHVHFWNVKMTRRAEKAEIIDALRYSARIAFVNSTLGIKANNSLKEIMLDIDRPYGDMYEVALWEDMLTVHNDEVFYAYVVDNQAIVIPENLDAIRALTGKETNAMNSMLKTDTSLGITDDFLGVEPTRRRIMAEKESMVQGT